MPRHIWKVGVRLWLLRSLAQNINSRESVFSQMSQNQFGDYWGGSHALNVKIVLTQSNLETSYDDSAFTCNICDFRYE